MYTNAVKDTAIMFNYMVSSRYGAASQSPIKLKGLNATAKYTVKEINLFPGTKSYLPADANYSGDYLMKVGYNPMLNGRRTSVILQLTASK